MNKKTILKIVNNKTGLNIKNKTRQRDYSEARFIYYDLCRRYADDGKSLASIGKTVKKDHATVLHGIRYCESQLEIKNKEFEFKYNNIHSIVNNYRANEKRFNSEDTILERLMFVENQLRLSLNINQDLKKENKKLNKRIQDLKCGAKY